MVNQPAGSLWLKQKLGLKNYRLTHHSYIGTRDKIEISMDGTVEQIYGPKYAPNDTILAHIEFNLKYDDLSLDFLSAVFRRTEETEIVNFIAQNPNGKYTRKIGFLYEWLTGKKLQIDVEPGGSYSDLLDSDRYITGNSIRNSRWKINDNLLGSPDFCPIIRKTQALNKILLADFKGQIDELKAEYTHEVFARATQYLYRKETKSSYEIESEKPSPDRVNRFIAILHQAGSQPVKETLSEKNLTGLQNAIVDPRYAQPGYRDSQNYIGQTDYRMEEIYHYICPPPMLVHSMMEGLNTVEQKTIGKSAVIRAAMIAFGFVFIHPFLDGNGRIHRFLIHDCLTRDGLTEKGFIIPVSAHMLNNIKDYDEALEDFSKPLMTRISFKTEANGQVIITNPEDVETYFKYPDLTFQSIYLGQTIQFTINEDLSEELYFLERYDELKTELQNFIDMPDKRLNIIIIFLHQNKGLFPNRRKKDFPEITDEEFAIMETIYSNVFTNEK